MGRRPPLRGRLGLGLILAGCGQPAPPPCTWCAAEEPRVRTCQSVEVAAGGQPVCVDDGEARLCQPATECR